MSDTAERARVLVRCPTRVGGHDWSDEPDIGPSYCFACGMQKRDHDALAALLSEYEAQSKRIMELERERKVLAGFYWAVRRGEKPDVENPVLFAVGQEEEADGTG